MLSTFVVDCPRCKAKVAADEKGRAERGGFDDDAGEPWSERLLLGSCPNCGILLVGETHQTRFENYNSDEDQWSVVIRVYPSPPKAFRSDRIPRVVVESLEEADRAMQASAYTAACVMFGRALEAICRDTLQSSSPKTDTSSKKRIMLGEGIRKLKAQGFIDDRLYDWSQQLQAFRNLAAHPDEEFRIARDDADDLQAFMHAITEYIYDLADRYEEFKERLNRRAKRKKS